jgi:hypothetical protein
VTSTNLAHTAQYCLASSLKTMAERYHRNVSCNSTLVPPHFPIAFATRPRNNRSSAD